MIEDMKKHMEQAVIEEIIETEEGFIIRLRSGFELKVEPSSCAYLKVSMRQPSDWVPLSA